VLTLAPVSTNVPEVGAVVVGFSFVVAGVFSTMPTVVIVDRVAVVFASAKTV